jgi:hypothetical protein
MLSRVYNIWRRYRTYSSAEQGCAVNPGMQALVDGLHCR